jgi:hypothetical protein
VEPPPFDEQASSAAFEDAVRYWRGWLRHSRYAGRWREVVHRGALTLKLLTYAPTGAIVAAPTTSLPEQLGGERNWDYRYTWVRDAAFSLYALLRLGFTEEAAAFMDWLTHRFRDCRGGATGPLQIMYGIDGRSQLPEQVLRHLEGYEGSAPVRIGNGAASQLQLDIYGELIDSVYLYNKYGTPIFHDAWEDLSRIVEWFRLVHRGAASSDFERSVDTSGCTNRANLPNVPESDDGFGHDFRNGENQQTEIRVTGRARFVRAGNDLGVGPGDRSATRGTARYACRSPRIGPPASTSATPATSSKQARSPIPPDGRTVDDTAMPEFGDEEDRDGFSMCDLLRSFCGFAAATRGRSLAWHCGHAAGTPGPLEAIAPPAGVARLLPVERSHARDGRGAAEIGR